MATVSKKIADEIVAGKYKSDGPFKIVKYTNAFNGEDAYGVCMRGDDPNRYKASDFIINPTTYWEAKK